MAPDVQPGDLTFEEAIKYFEAKVKRPSKKWTDFMKGQHAQAFVVAGATQQQLLADLHGEILKAMKEGTGLEEFRAAFDKTVDKHGWSYNGSRNWRTRVIFETNMRTAYQVGRYAQLKETIALRPFWQYRHGDSRHPRPLHVSWDRLVLRHDDPWWKTHYPPNGWGCKCTVLSLAEEDITDQGKAGPDQAPDNGFGDKRDPVTGEPVPAGIDPGWDYNPGQAAWGERLSDEAMAEWRKQGRDAWEQLTPGDWESYGLPEKLPPRPTEASLRPKAPDKEAFRQMIEDAIGGEQQVFTAGAGDEAVPVLVNAKKFADHVSVARSEFIELLPESLTDADEVWIGFERHKGTGRVQLRATVIRAATLRDKTVVVSAVGAKEGALEGWSILPSDRLDYVNTLRRGLLLYRKSAQDPTQQGGPPERS